MHYSQLAEGEQAVLNPDIPSKFIFEKFVLPIPGSDIEQLSGYTCRPKDGYSGYYYAEKAPKNQIVLHFTAGHIQGDLHSLTYGNGEHVSTAFVIGRNGTVYQLFSSAHWSYHLGRGAVGGNTRGSKHSIAIELSNYGPLVPEGGQLMCWHDDVYCDLATAEAYRQLDSPFRDRHYYASFSDAQYESLVVLLRYLTASYDIPRSVLPEADRYMPISEDTALNFKGILSHVNFRPSGKWDIGPAFDWGRMIAGMMADRFEGPPVIAERGVEVIGSRDMLEEVFPVSDANVYRPGMYGEDGPDA